MAFKMQVRSDDTVDHPNAYWRVNTFSGDKSARTVVFTFLAYHDKAAARDGASPLAHLEKTYAITGDDFDRLYAGNAGSAPAAKFYQVARATQDEPDGSGGMRGFFDDATDDV